MHIIFSKLTQLKAYNSIYKYDFICPLETYLDSSIRDSFLNIEEYNLVCTDHPDNIKRGGVCIYYKESLPVRVYVYLILTKRYFYKWITTIKSLQYL